MGWGLACNSIHFIDLIQYLSHSKVSQVQTHGLTRSKPAKRPGFMELFGTLDIQFENRSSISLKCNEGEPFLSLSLTNNSNHFQISEITQQAWKHNPTLTEFIEIPHPQINQSQLSHQIVEEIWETKNCNLPHYNESMETQLKLILAFNDFFISQGCNIYDETCPIT
jgi:hypothetical protein